MTIAGQQFSVSQSQGCTFAIDRPTESVSQAGGSGTLTVTTGAACPWTAASNVSWLSVTPSSGTGRGVVTFDVDATGGPQRTGTAVIAGQLFTVTQSPGCAFDVQPASHSIGAAGGTGNVSVVTNPGCGWASSSSVPWITIQGATTGNGPGGVTFAVASTTGPARTGTLTVAGRQVTVTQTQGCTYAISPQNQNVASSGGGGRVSVTTGDGCAWAAASAVPWITVSAGANGSGSGEVQFSVAATNGPGRSGTLTIAGHTFTVTQGQGCTATLSPSQADVENAGGARAFDVQTAAGCAWTATTSTPWISITSGASGSGNGTVRFTVAANPGPGRTGAITAGGQTFTVTQGTGCSVSLSSERQDVPASGGSGSVAVTAGNGCTWEVTRNTPGDSWLAITSGTSGSGNGSVTFSVAENTGAARSTSLTIGGRTFTINQAGAPCTYAINPSQATVPSSAGSFDVDVTTTGGGCAWQATSHAPWIQIAMGTTGNNNGRVRLNVEANGGPQRTGTVTIAGHTFTLTQTGGCTFGVAPDTVAGMAASGGTARVDVTTSATCGWAATSNADWITIAQPGSGSGNGSVELVVAANTSTDPRTGTVTVATQTVTVTQQAAAPAPSCVVTLTPSAATVPLTGGTGTFAVAAPDGCVWAAAPSDAWITISAGASGTGNGTVEFSVAAGTAARSGTIVVNGQTFTITQQ